MCGSARSPVMIGACLLALGARSAVCRAAIVDVPADQPTIQLGIEAASSGDTVLIAPGTYSEKIDFLGKRIVVGGLYVTTGEPAFVDSTVLSGEGLSAGPLVTMTTGEDSLSVLAGLTVTRGSAYFGGGVYCRYASPRIADCVFLSNEAGGFGGGVYGLYASPIIERCRFEDNEAGSSGGGVSVLEGSPRITGSSFTGNFAGGSGGAICVESGCTLICDNVVDGNTGYSAYAGGIMSRNSASVIVRNVISDNTTSGCGGGLFY